MRAAYHAERTCARTALTVARGLRIVLKGGRSQRSFARMRIGVPKEIKNEEHRVGLTPASARELVLHGHEVIVETRAGYDIGFDDGDYQAAGARIGANAEDVFTAAQMIVKVKEPQAAELKRLRPDHVL